MIRRRGFTLIELLLSIAIGAVIAVVAVPNFVAARKHDCELGAVRGLRTIATCEAIFREGDKDGDKVPDYGTLSELNDTRIVDRELGSGSRQGYVFQAAASHVTPELLWFGVANPAPARVTGDRSFATNHAGVIWYTTAGPLSLDTSSCSLPNNGVYPCGCK